MRNKVKHKKLNEFTESIVSSATMVPAFIPNDTNVYFPRDNIISDAYSAGANVEIVDNILTKKDTTYEAGDTFINVNNNTHVISASDVDGTIYNAGNNIVMTDETVGATHYKNVSTTGFVKPNDQILHEKLQPVYRTITSGIEQTHFAGFSNETYTIGDPFYEEDSAQQPISGTEITRITCNSGTGTAKILCLAHTDPPVSNPPSATINVNEFYKYNQFIVHQHIAGSLYLDVEFFKQHLGKEITINKIFFVNNGSKLFFTAGTNKLIVYLYSCGLIQCGLTTDTNHELSLQPINYNLWAAGIDANSFNYMTRPYESTNIFGITNYTSSRDNWWYITSGGQEHRVFPIYNTPPTILEHNTFYMKPVKLYSYPGPRTLDTLMLNCVDPHYDFFDFGGKKVWTTYRLATEQETQGPGEIHRSDNYIPYDPADEYFTAGRFVVMAFNEGVELQDENGNHSKYDMLYLADSRF